LRTIGLIGGVMWPSTAEYYRLINQAVARALGGAASARLVLVSLNFEDVLRAAQDQSSNEHSRLYVEAAHKLRLAGAGFIVICSNTGHRRADDIEQGVGVKVLHIADVTARAVRATGYHRVALLGTAATMEAPFIKGRLQDRWGLDVIVPDTDTRRALDRMIIGNLAQGDFSEEGRQFVRQTIERMHREHCVQATVLGCTELRILLGDVAHPYPTFDTLRLHAEAAAERALVPQPATPNS
jgi:amino-acid racemase